MSGGRGGILCLVETWGERTLSRHLPIVKSIHQILKKKKKKKTRQEYNLS